MSWRSWTFFSRGAIGFITVTSLLLCAHRTSETVRVGQARKITPGLSGKGQRQASIAAGEDGFLVVWSEGIGGGCSVLAARIDPDGNSLDPAGIELGQLGGCQFEPNVAAGHGIYYVV